MSSGRRYCRRTKGSSANTVTATATHAYRHPRAAMRLCSHGKITIDAMPTPENAMPTASPRRRMNQFGRNSP